jgi:diphthine-ammonia ligase
MKLAALFSGGKDSTYALFKAMQYHDIACLITMKSKNTESYMFHTPNIDISSLQADAIGLPQIISGTSGKKELELRDLKKAIRRAIREYKIEGIVTGAIESVYQATRIQKIAKELRIWCFSPLWKKDQLELLDELIRNRFEIIILSVAAYPLGKEWLGRKLTRDALAELKTMKVKYGINPAGEGGEYESLVIDAPFFGRRIEILKSEKKFEDGSGSLIIREAR